MPENRPQFSAGWWICVGMAVATALWLLIADWKAGDLW